MLTTKNLNKILLKLPDLNFKQNELEPFISEKTISYHYFKHHNGYIQKTKELLNLSFDYEGEINIFEKIKEKNFLSFNIKQILNHNLFWLSIKKQQVEKVYEEFFLNYFLSFENFKNKFISTGLSIEGSGWIWIWKNSKEIFIQSFPNGDIPFHIIENEENKILNVCDVWEHSYYIDYFNDKKTYLFNFVNFLMKINL